MAYQSEIEKLEARFREKPEQWFAALADQYRKAGDLDMALELLNAWIDKRPNYTSGYIVLGRCLLDRERLGDAANAFENVLRLDMENVIALKSLSEIAEQRGDLDSARTWLKRLLDVDPMNDEAREALENVGRPKTGEVTAVETVEAGEPGAFADAGQVAEPVEMAEFEAGEVDDTPLDIERVSEPEGFTLPEPEAAGTAGAVESAQLGMLEEPAEPVAAEEPMAGSEAPGGPESIEPMLDLEPTEFEGPSEVEPLAVEGLEPAGYGAPSDEPLIEEGRAESLEPEESTEPAEEPPFAESGVPGTEARSGDAEPPTDVDAGGPEPAETSLVGVPELEEYTDAATDEQAESGAVAEPDEPVAAFEEDLPLAAGPGALEPAPQPESEPEFGPAVESAVAEERDGVRFIEPSPDVAEEAEPEVGAADVEPVLEEEREESRPELPIILPEEVAAELDEPGVREPEPVLTETMAELYVSQGLYAEARDIYGKLLERNPGSERIRNRLAEVVEQAAGAKAEVAPSRSDRYAAGATGGLSVAELMRQLTGASGGSGAAATTGEGAPEATNGSGFSFDEYFGSGDAAQGSSGSSDAPPVSDSEPARPSEGPEDEDFRDWLKGLKT